MLKKVGSSIKAQLAIVIVLIMAVPLIAATASSSIMSFKKNLEDVETYNKAIAQSIEKDIVLTMDNNIQALQAFASAPSTIAYIKQQNGEGIDGVGMPKENMLKHMQTIDNALADGNCTIVSGNKGMQLLRTEGDPVDISDCEYYKTAMSGQIYASNVQLSKSTGEYICTFAVPVFDEDGKTVIGIVQRNYNLSDFHELLASEVFEDKHEIVMVDRDGNVLAHSGHELDPNATELESQASNPFYTDSRDENATTGSYVSPWQGENWMISWVKEPNTGWVVASCRVQSVALADVTRTLIVMIIIGVIALALATFLAIRFAGRISNPIKSVAESVDGLTSGYLMTEFDEAPAKRDDEVGQIAKNSIGLANNLQEVIGRSKEMAEDLKEAGSELARSSEQASAAANQVSEAVDEVSKGAISQAESVQDAVTNMENIGDAVEAISTSTDELNNASKTMEKNCDETMNSLKTLITQSEKVSESVETIADTINRTNDSANEISNFTEAINSIATQTNLLSLNASIEAARAGEAGKGFAVVASEISNLAAQSKESADKINEIVIKLMADASSSVDVMTVLKDNFTEQGNQLDATRERMDQMADGITAVASSAEHISGRVDDLRSSKDSLSGIIDDLSAISEENAASTEQTNASMEELNATFSMINESANSLQKSAEELDDMIGFFKLDAVTDISVDE